MKATKNAFVSGEKTAFVGRAALISPVMMISREGYINITGSGKSGCTSRETTGHFAYATLDYPELS